VLDIDMPKLDGFGVAREIAARQLPIATIFLTMHSGEDPFRAAMDLGAKGYILKDSAMLEIVTGIRAVAAGRPYLSSTLTLPLLRRQAITGVRENTPATGSQQWNVASCS
jgi:DNA-binding NarL/FixJ family response regulator